MRYLHTMIRVTDLDASLAFFIGKLGMVEIASPCQRERPLHAGVPRRARRRGGGAGARRRSVELTYNWDPEDYAGGRNFGHLAYEVDDIYDYCAKLREAGIVINRPPRDGRMAFIRTPDNISIELLQKGRGAAARGAVDVDGEHRGVVRRVTVDEPPGESVGRRCRGRSLRRGRRVRARVDGL